MMEMEQMMERLLARMDIKQAADRKADRDELKEIMNAFQEKMDSNQAKAAKQEEFPAKISANVSTIEAQCGQCEGYITCSK
jgi:hypothetical protein